MTYCDYVNVAAVSNTINADGIFDIEYEIEQKCFKCYGTTNVLDRTGKQVVSNVKIYFPPETDIEENNLIKLDNDVNSEYLEIKSFNILRNINGIIHHYVVYL